MYFVYIQIMLMMKCTVITPWPVWLGAAPCLFGMLSKPSYSCPYLYFTNCTEYCALLQSTSTSPAGLTGQSHPTLAPDENHVRPAASKVRRRIATQSSVFLMATGVKFSVCYSVPNHFICCSLFRSTVTWSGMKRC